MIIVRATNHDKNNDVGDGMMIMIIKKGVSKKVAYRILRAMLLEVTYRNDTSTKSIFLVDSYQDSARLNAP